MLCVVLEGLEVGVEGRGVGVDEMKVGDLVEERRAVVLKVCEGLLEVELGLFLFGRWEICWIIGFSEVHFSRERKRVCDYWIIGYLLL